MSRSRNVTLLILDGAETKEVKIRRGIVKNFNLIVLVIMLLFIGLLSILFFFIYNSAYTQFIAEENQKLRMQNYDLNQKISNLNDSIENELGSRINELDKANVLIESVRKYLKNRGVNIENKLITLAQNKTNKYLINTSNKTISFKNNDKLYNEDQLSFLLETLSKVPLGFPHVGRVTSSFGYRVHPITKQKNSFHTGMDIAGTVGAPVKATADGIVTFAGTNKGYGRMIIVQHGYGYSTAYSHLSKINVALNQTIKAGDIIGNVGNSGHSTGSHLHYEVRYENEPINPNSYLSLGN